MCDHDKGLYKFTFTFTFTFALLHYVDYYTSIEASPHSVQGQRFPWWRCTLRIRFVETLSTTSSDCRDGVTHESSVNTRDSANRCDGRQAAGVAYAEGKMHGWAVIGGTEREHRCVGDERHLSSCIIYERKTILAGVTCQRCFRYFWTNNRKVRDDYICFMCSSLCWVCMSPSF